MNKRCGSMLQLRELCHISSSFRTKGTKRRNISIMVEHPIQRTTGCIGCGKSDGNPSSPALGHDVHCIPGPDSPNLTRIFDPQINPSFLFSSDHPVLQTSLLAYIQSWQSCVMLPIYHTLFGVLAVCGVALSRDVIGYADRNW